MGGSVLCWALGCAVAQSCWRYKEGEPPQKVRFHCTYKRCSNKRCPLRSLGLFLFKAVVSDGKEAANREEQREKPKRVSAFASLLFLSLGGLL